MNCPNCGTLNKEGSNFCIKCGQKLMSEGVNNVVSTETNVDIKTLTENNNVSNLNIQNINDVKTQNNLIENNTMQNNNLQNDSTANSSVNQDAVKISFIGYFFIIVAVILKPFTSLKEELHKFDGFKNSAILSLIISGMATIMNLLSKMWFIVRVREYSWEKGRYITSWVWGNLKNIEYIEVIAKNFLIYLGTIVVVAVIYYLGSLIIKKQVNFSRLLGISALALTPLLICSLVLSPLLSMILSELMIPIIIIGVVYTMVIFYEGINNELLLEGNIKYYFNLVCFSVLGITVYYLGMKILISSISGGLSNLTNIFG